MHRTTLNRFLIEERRRHPDATGDLNALINDVAIACKAIAKRVAYGGIENILGASSTTNIQGETQQKLDVIANEMFLRANEWDGHLAGMVSEEMEAPFLIPARFPKGRYLLTFDPLDGSSNIDVNLSVGSIFSILRATMPGADATAADFLQPGSKQVCAGYAIYGPSTMLVITVGTGVHGFTLDPQLGEFILTHPALRIPTAAAEFAINASNSRFWEPAVKRYVDECLAGNGPARQGLQYAVHRIARRRGAPHPRAWRHFFVPPRQQGAGQSGPAAATLRGQSDGFHCRASRRTGQHGA